MGRSGQDQLDIWMPDSEPAYESRLYGQHCWYTIPVQVSYTG